MHILNLNRKPHLILTHKEILFREGPNDREMKRYPFEELEKVSLDHYYDLEDKRIVALQIQISNIEKPFAIELSSLDEPLANVLDLLHVHFSNKTKFSLPSSAWLNKLQDPSKKRKSLLLVAALFLTTIFSIHEFVPPKLQGLQQDALMVQEQTKQEICSANARAAYPIAGSKNVSIQNFCGILGFWRKTSSVDIPQRFLQTEFSSTSEAEYLTQAQHNIQVQAFDLAIENLQNVLYLNPSNSEAYVLLGYCYYWKKETALALETTKKALELAPDSAEAHSAIGLLYIEAKEFKKAYEHYTKSSQIKPTAKTYMALGDLALDLGEMNSSISHYEDALSLDTNNTALLTQLGLLYWEELAYTKAAKVFELAYRAMPSNIDNFLNYYEISMIQKTSLSLPDEESFVKAFQEQKNALMIYDTLKIVKLSIEQKDIIPALKQWAENYSNLKLKWSFKQILTWLEGSSLSEDEQYYVRKTIGFFIAYQQRYNLEHQAEL